ELIEEGRRVTVDYNEVQNGQITDHRVTQEGFIRDFSIEKRGDDYVLFLNLAPENPYAREYVDTRNNNVSFRVALTRGMHANPQGLQGAFPHIGHGGFYLDLSIQNPQVSLEPGFGQESVLATLTRSWRGS